MMARKKTNDRPKVPPAVRWLFRTLDRLSPRLAGRLAARLFLRTRRHRVSEKEAATLDDASRHELMTEHGPAVAWVWKRTIPVSPEPTVFLLHGWEGRASQLGSFVEPLREAGYRVVAVDAPGHGHAPGSSSSLVALGAALEAAVERWGPAAGVIGHSSGAIGTTFALSRGLEAPRVVFVSPGSDLPAYTRYFGRLLGLGAAATGEIVTSIERRIGLRFEAIEPLELARSRTTPMLALSDRDDRETPLPAVERLVGRWPGAVLEVTEGLGHVRILRDPDVVSRAVAFVTGRSERERLEVAS